MHQKIYYKELDSIRAVAAFSILIAHCYPCSIFARVFHFGRFGVILFFIVSGFWHGANWTFLAWGTLNAIFIMPSIIMNTNRNNMETVALELIRTSESNPDHVNSDGNTALILACKNKMEQAAIQIIDTYKSNFEHKDTKCFTALMYACENNLIDVIKALTTIVIVMICILMKV